MVRSMYSGVSGLRVHQTKMDVIGNNIANVNTTGFKSSRVTFNEIFSQTLQGGTAATKDGAGGQNPMQVGLGVNVSTIDIQMTEGAAQRTDNALDLKINGDGFFVVTDGLDKKFTRAGAFRVDEAGNLVAPGGYKVCGWPVQGKNNDIIKGPVEPLAIVTPDTYSVAPVKTTKISFEGNLNTTDADDMSDDVRGIPLTINFYDSLGNKYTAELDAKYDKDSEDWIVNKFTYIKDESGNDVTVGGNKLSEEYTDLDFKFKYNAEGELVTEGDYKDKFELDFSSYDFDGVNSELGEGGKVKLDFSGLTQYSTPTTAKQGEFDGNAAGKFTGFNVGVDGIITAKYSNGDSKKLGQIVITTFKNPAGLQKVGSNMFCTSPNSGFFDGVGQDPTTVGGLNAGVLEMSNVDLSKEFTEMITTQRGFQANSRIITTSDEMLQELTNLKR